MNLKSFYQRIQPTLSQISQPSELRTVLLTILITTSLLLGLRHLGRLQLLELIVFDRLVRLQPERGVDPRLLIVEINEADIRNLKRWPPSDRSIANALRELQHHHPVAIGLDLARDIPNEPGYEDLKAELQRPNVIAATFVSQSERERIAPPPSMAEEQVGFSNLPVDRDGIVRSNLLFISDGKTVLPSFSLSLAQLYFDRQGISYGVADPNEYQLGQTILAKMQPNSGNYQNNHNAQGYLIQLDYRSRRTPAQKVSLTQVLQRQVHPNWIRNKVILIGATAPSLKDLFSTPYSGTEFGHQLMAGVEIQAQMVSQLLSIGLDHRAPFRFWSEWTETLWIIFWSSISGLFVLWIRNPIVWAGSSVLFLLIVTVIGYQLFLQQTWIPIATPALGLLLTGSSAITLQLYQARQQARMQQQMVMSLLGQQTSPEIATALWGSRDRLLESGMLPWQTLTATILFTDLKNFSTISEKNAPEVVMTWLNQYLSAMTEEVQRHQGIINKFTGDGVMAVFGVPVARATSEEIALDAQRAVQCALAMGDRLQELNQQWVLQNLPPLQMRVGIFTGPVMVGSLGGKNRLEYGVIGDSVNIASRLESYAKERQVTDCRVLIAQETLQYLEDKFLVEAWGETALKGKEKLTVVYRVVNPDGNRLNRDSLKD